MGNISKLNINLYFYNEVHCILSGYPNTKQNITPNLALNHPLGISIMKRDKYVEYNISTTLVRTLYRI